MRRVMVMILGLCFSAAVLGGCSSDDDNNSVTQPAMGTLTLSMTGLEDLGPTAAYEGWIIVGGSAVSTGTFTVDTGGTPSKTAFQLLKSDIDAATAFILTIEPVPDPDTSPAATHLIAGPFTNGSADLVVADAAALGDDFTSASGSYILETPSTSGTAGDYGSGIWWLDPGAGPGAALSLPTLPAGWSYEGWVVGPSGPITTGRFLLAAGTDSDGTGPTAGPDAGPPFPGQDYITPLLSIIGYTAVISIEPEPDNSPDPFTLKPLIDADVVDVGAGVLQPMVDNTVSFPTGTATR